jgi:alpha-ribazole phosphatase/probable phosphoglycerate mutase
MTTVYLVRHGITAANKEDRFAGRTGEELHPGGIEQMRQVGERLRGKNIAAIYCGPARRTVQSAEILSLQLNVPVASIAAFDEILIPHWDGLTKDEIRQKHGMEYPTWIDSPQTFSVSGCETLQQVQNRAVEGLVRLLENHMQSSGNLLIVSHLIVLRCLVLYYQGLEISDFRSVQIGNGAIISLGADEGGWLQVSVL